MGKIITFMKKYVFSERITMINVVDSIMGSGKTTYAIDRMNSNPDKKYIYVAVSLNEVNRIKEACPTLYFAEPEDLPTKTASFQMLLDEGCNVVTTHQLLQRQEVSQRL